MPDIHRPDFSFESSWQTAALLVGLAGTILLAGTLIWLRTELLQRRCELEERLGV